MKPFIEVLLHLLLFIFFLAFFGIPALVKYGREETITISSLELTHGIEAPAVTLIGLKNSTGWKRAPASIDSESLFAFSLFDHCKEINIADLDACISSDSIGLTDFLTEAGFGMGNLAQHEPSWTEDMGVTVQGRYFTWSPTKVLTPNQTDIMFFTAYRNFTFSIFVHDTNFFVVNVNPLGPPMSFWQFKGQSTPSHYQEITLTKHKKLNLGHRPCEELKDYSFTICVKESLSQQVGCRMPWDRWSQEEREVCTAESQIKVFEQLNWLLMQVLVLMLMLMLMLMQVEVDEIVRVTGCKKPCSYKEYKLMNSNPREILLAEFPKDQIGFALWAVSQNTQYDEEVHIIKCSLYFSKPYTNPSFSLLSFPVNPTLLCFFSIPPLFAE